MIPVVLLASYFIMNRFSKNEAEKKYYEIVQLVRNNKVSEFELNLYSGQLTYKQRGDTSGKTYTYS